MSKNENQPNVVLQLRPIPLPVTDEIIKDFNIEPSTVQYHRIGSRNFRCIFVQGTPEQYKAVVNPIELEIKRDDREGRCQIVGKRGKLIRCPDSRRCENCERALLMTRVDNKPASVEFLIENGLDPANKNSVEEDTVTNEMEKWLVKKLSAKKSRYGKIFHLRYQGFNEAEIAKLLNLSQSTISAELKKVEALAQSLTADIYHR